MFLVHAQNLRQRRWGTLRTCRGSDEEAHDNSMQRLHHGAQPMDGRADMRMVWTVPQCEEGS